MNLNIVEYFDNKRYLTTHKRMINNYLPESQPLNILELKSKATLLYLAETKNSYKIINKIQQCYIQKPTAYFNEYIFVFSRQAAKIDNLDIINYVYQNFIINSEKTQILIDIATKHNSFCVIDYLLNVEYLRRINVYTTNPLFLKNIYKDSYCFDSICTYDNKVKHDEYDKQNSDTNFYYVDNTKLIANPINSDSLITLTNCLDLNKNENRPFVYKKMTSRYCCNIM